jgi:hypothetical protein
MPPMTKPNVASFLDRLFNINLSLMRF